MNKLNKLEYQDRKFDEMDKIINLSCNKMNSFISFIVKLYEFISKTTNA